MHAHNRRVQPPPQPRLAARLCLAARLECLSMQHMRGRLACGETRPQRSYMLAGSFALASGAKCGESTCCAQREQNLEKLLVVSVKKLISKSIKMVKLWASQPEFKVVKVSDPPENHPTPYDDGGELHNFRADV